MRNWKLLEDEYDCLYMIADLHAITVRQEPAKLRAQSIQLLALLLAADLNVLCLGGTKCSFLGAAHWSSTLLGILAAALLACGPVQWFWMKWKGRVLAQDGSVTVASWIGYMAILWFSILLLVNNTYNPFIYFRF